MSGRSGRNTLSRDENRAGNLQWQHCCRFELPAFYKEVRRILKPSGAFAAWGYDLCEFPENKEANKVLEHLYNGVLGPYWSERRRLVEMQYKGKHNQSATSNNLPLSLEAVADADAN